MWKRKDGKKYVCSLFVIVTSSISKMKFWGQLNSAILTKRLVYFLGRIEKVLRKRERDHDRSLEHSSCEYKISFGEYRYYSLVSNIVKNCGKTAAIAKNCLLLKKFLAN